MRRATLISLLGLSFAAVPGRASSSPATCDGYQCPIDYNLRPNAGHIQCLVASGCGDQDKGTCCLHVNGHTVPTTPPTHAPASTSDGGSDPCQPFVPGKPAPHNPCATPAPVSTTMPIPPPPPVATCASYTCPAGMVQKGMPQLIYCTDPSGCTATDTANCCGAATTTLPPMTTPAMIVPEGCQVTVPAGGFAPWEIYKVMKTAAHKIRTPSKDVMGGQTLMFKSLNVASSSFTCSKVQNEMRARVRAPSAYLAPLFVNNSLAPNHTQMQCSLGAISLYKSPSGIPGMRLDYDDCPVGPGRQATVLIGLKKVPDSTVTPGLRAFFEHVCASNASSASLFERQLRFDLNSHSGSCFAYSATAQVLSSEHNCFDPVMVFTLLDSQNYFPLFSVTDSEWAWLVKNIPAMVPAGAAIQSTAAAASEPCAKPVAPVTTHAKVYGHSVNDRFCVKFLDGAFACDNDCGKFMTAELLSIDQPLPLKSSICETCYDCEYDKILYAFFGTLLAFYITHWIYFKSSATELTMSWTGYLKPGESYYKSSQINDSGGYTQISSPSKVHPDLLCQAIIAFGIMALIVTLLSYAIVSACNFFVTVQLKQKEMCLKVWPFQSQFNSTFRSENQPHWGLLEGETPYFCFNQACMFRILDLILATWLPLWALFAYWRMYQVQVKSSTPTFVVEETEVSHGGVTFKSQNLTFEVKETEANALEHNAAIK